jgi:hypothetical protein
MLPESSSTSPGRARAPSMSRPKPAAAPDTGGADEHAIALAAFDHLGVAR